jgi:hypothetical protein
MSLTRSGTHQISRSPRLLWKWKTDNTIDVLLGDVRDVAEWSAPPSTAAASATTLRPVRLHHLGAGNRGTLRLGDAPDNVRLVSHTECGGGLGHGWLSHEVWQRLLTDGLAKRSDHDAVVECRWRDGAWHVVQSRWRERERPNYVTVIHDTMRAIRYGWSCDELQRRLLRVAGAN